MIKKYSKEKNIEFNTRNIMVINTVPMGINGISSVILGINNSIDLEQLKIDYVINNDCEESIKNKLKYRGSKVFVVKNRLRRPIKYFLCLVKLLKGYDVIHVHGNSATMVIEMMAAKIAGVSLRIAHSHSTGCKYIVIDKICRPFFYLLCNRYIACSDLAGKWLFKKNKYLVLKNGINTRRFAFSYSTRVTMRDKLGWNDQCVICHVGEFTQTKNHKFIIDVFYSLSLKNKCYKLLLVGEGCLKDEIKEYTIKLGIDSQILFYGETNNVPELLDASDCIIMPSYNEGFPMTLIEGQANGLRCIVSDTITRDVNITGDVDFISIDHGVNEWVNTIEGKDFEDDRTEKSLKNIESIVRQGYSVESLSNEMRRIYMIGALNE